MPAAGEVLVRVRATSVNPYDWHLLRGEPRVARLMPGLVGLRAPKFPVPGCDLAGQVEAPGPGVTQFRPGDDVFALVSHGCYAEYVTVPETMLARMPGNLSFEQAAAVPMAALTALIGLRDTGRVESGQQVLVNGASGGVGTFAVQLARAFGARADAVCRAANAELVRSLGADDGHRPRHRGLHPLREALRPAAGHRGHPPGAGLPPRARPHGHDSAHRRPGRALAAARRATCSPRWR